MKHILVPVDGSEGAGRAAAFAARLGAPHDAKLSLLFVYDAPAVVSMGLAGLAGDEAMAKAARESADKAFSAALEAIGDAAKVEPSREIAEGNPTVEILAYAENSNVDLIVMGSRGLSSIEGLVMGSVSERVLRAAPCPVTIVR
jgi:nucleotide-binding universal stress UspA family protein